MILIDNCEKKLILSEDGFAISFEEYDRMQKGLMKTKHPNLIVEEPRNKWVKSFIKAERDKREIANLMETMGYF